MGCDQYEFVDTDEYLVIKKDEVREFNKKVTWTGLEILVSVDIKYFNQSLNYQISLEDLKGRVISEMDYYSRLRTGELRLVFQDIDNFDLIKITENVSRYTKVRDYQDQVDELVLNGSVLLDKETYYKIENLTIKTIDI